MNLYLLVMYCFFLFKQFICDFSSHTLVIFGPSSLPLKILAASSGEGPGPAYEVDLAKWFNAFN